MICARVKAQLLLPASSAKYIAAIMRVPQIKNKKKREENIGDDASKEFYWRIADGT